MERWIKTDLLVLFVKLIVAKCLSLKLDRHTPCFYLIELLFLPIMSSPKSFNFRLFFKFLPRKTEQKMYDSHCILY